MVDGSQGDTLKVADSIDRNGTITWSDWTYNGGVMVGAATALYRMTGDPAYLRDAQGFAKYIMGA